MKNDGFVKGMAMGVAMGAAMVAMVAPPKKGSVKKAAGKAMKTMTQAMEDLSETMGFR